jgi:hypothetical protein
MPHSGGIFRSSTGTPTTRPIIKAGLLHRRPYKPLAPRILSELPTLAANRPESHDATSGGLSELLTVLSPEGEL